MLREEVGGEREVPAEGENVRELLDDLMTASRRSARSSSATTRSRRSSTSMSRARTSARSTASTRRSRHGQTVILLPAMAGGGMTSAQELYELWAGDSVRSARQLGESLEPRGTDWLFELFASLGPQPGDARPRRRRARRQARDRLVARARAARVALDPLPCTRARAASPRRARTIESSRARSRSMPLEDASVDWIWCRDVLVHVDSSAASRSARACWPGGRMLAYVTLATDCSSRARRPGSWTRSRSASLDADRDRGGRAAAGLSSRETVELGSEWRERMIEDGEWDPARRRCLRARRAMRRSRA